ncbi:MAG: hypothetical protein KGP35_07265 [Bacteroidetes bacterium]|nr:hypothetical protein [Bacteroidota bacterium]
MERPPELICNTKFNLKTKFPKTAYPVIDEQFPTLIYYAYNLDPLWYQNIKANRILLLEPSHYQKNPVSEKVIDFMIRLSANIQNIQIYTGEFEELLTYSGKSDIIFKKHPAFVQYKGTAVSHDYLFPQVSEYFNSFFPIGRSVKNTYRHKRIGK